jgi:mannosyltransferase OCH1-like enzyme
LLLYRKQQQQQQKKGGRKRIGAGLRFQIVISLGIIVVVIVTLQISFYSLQDATTTTTTTNTNNQNVVRRTNDQVEPTIIDENHHHHHHQQQQQQPIQEDYAIPKILIFTHYKNLLTFPVDKMTDEEKSLSENVQHSVDVHREDNLTNVLFWTDGECIESLRRVYPSLVEHFVQETQGMYKADICRGVALYENGGFYLDVDVGVRHSLWTDLRRTTKFVTSRVHTQSKYPGHYFQAILGVSPRNNVIFKYLQLFERHYKGVVVVKNGPLGVILLKRAWDSISTEDKALNAETELYQEILYNSKLLPNLHPAPIWGGTKRACHFFVAAQANHKQNVEFELPINNSGGKNKKKKIGIHVPVVSRVPGSRMCPDIIVDDKTGDVTMPTPTKWWDR